MGRTGNIEEVRSENRRPSILSILIITIVLVAGAVSSVMFAYNLTKQSNSKSNTQKEKEDVIEQIVADIDKAQNSVTVEENKEPEVVVKTNEQIKEEKGEFTEEYKKYEEELTEEEKENSEVIPRKYEVEYEEIEEIIEKQEEEEIEEKIPSSFNLKDKITIETRNQGGYGICWDFALTKCIETNLALTTGKYYDLSEMYVDYTLSSEYSDGNYLRRLHDGGNGDYIKYINKMVFESDFPYGEYSVEEYRDAIGELKGEIYINDYVIFPSSHGETQDEIKKFRDTIKKHIMNYGSVYCSIASPQIGAEYMNDVNEYYTGEEKVTGYHAVSIIGWDDNYSKDNFDCNKKPSKDGAYIAVNSWGYDQQEYLYISYEDKLVETGLVGVVSVSTEYKDNSERIKIEDKALYDSLKNSMSYYYKGYDDNSQELIFDSKRINEISSIHISNTDIKSLKGLEIFKNITNISITDSEISDISAISEFEKLNVLILNNNKIEDFSAISELKALKTLSISGNPIKNIDFLDNMDSIVSLSISNYNITDKDIKNIKKQSNLNQISLVNCNIEDASFIQDLKNLKVLDLSNNVNIKNINYSSDVVNINLSGCGLTNIDFLKSDTELYGLNLSNNNLVSVKPLEDFKKIMSLNLSNNKNLELYNDFLVNVESLDLSDCNIDSIDFLAGGNYRTLILNNNNIENIANDLGMEKLAFINLANNPLANIDGLKRLPALMNINAENCNIKDASIFKGFEKLRYLTLNNNPGITGLNNIKVDEVTLSGCQLDNNTDLFSNTNVSTLYLTNNNITYIDPSFIANGNLRRLSIDEKVENASELYAFAGNSFMLYCPEVTVEKDIVLPSIECLKLVKNNSGFYSNSLTNNFNCEIEGDTIVLNTLDKYAFDFGFTQKSYTTSVNYIYHCTISDEVSGYFAQVISDKIMNKIIYETKDKNFNISSVRVDYGEIDDYEVTGYSTDFNVNYDNVNYESSYLPVTIHGYVGYLYISVFPEEMQTYTVEDIYDFTTVLESLTYPKVYSVDYDNRCFATSNEVVEKIEELIINRKLKDKELYKIFDGVKTLRFESTQLSVIDMSIVEGFRNLEYVTFLNCIPDSIDTTLNKGIHISGMSGYALRVKGLNSNEDLIKVESNRMYLPKVFSEAYNIDGCVISVNYTVSEKLDNRFDEDGNYIEPELYETITEFKVDENNSRLYIDNISLDDTKVIFLEVNVFIKDALSYNFHMTY